MLVAMTCICLSMGVIKGLVLVPSLWAPSIVSANLCGTLLFLGTITIRIVSFPQTAPTDDVKNQWVPFTFQLRVRRPVIKDNGSEKTPEGIRCRFLRRSSQ